MRRFLISAWAITALFSAIPSAFACPASRCKDDGSTKLSAERPWGIRYFIYVDDLQSAQIGKSVAQKSIAQERDSPKRHLARPFKHLFTPVLAARLPPIGFAVQEFGIVVIEFDRNGVVTTENASGHKLRGKLDENYHLVLESDTPADGPPYYLADWFRGWSDLMREFTPAFCAGFDDLRYQQKLEGTNYSDIGNFGCREWSYQIQDADRPYVDVTSYEGKETYIKRFYGWAPFDGPRKPVIGRHNKTWVCLLDCPRSAPPGIIPDIAKWSRENGFPIPKRPKKTPMFPNTDFPYDVVE